MPSTVLTLPYAHLNLRRNPFGERTPEERVTLAVVDTASWVERLRAPGGTVQFVGESGRGKTTRLLALRRSFPDAPFVRVHEDGRIDIPEAPVVFVDEVQHLSRRDRRTLFGGPASLALGTHVDYSSALRAAERKTETVLLRGLSEDLLRDIVETRVESARRGPGPVPRVESAVLRSLLEEYGDNVRAIENRLYDAVQDMKEPGHVEM